MKTQIHKKKQQTNKKLHTKSCGNFIHNHKLKILFTEAGHINQVIAIYLSSRREAGHFGLFFLNLLFCQAIFLTSDLSRHFISLNLLLSQALITSFLWVFAFPQYRNFQVHLLFLPCRASFAVLLMLTSGCLNLFYLVLAVLVIS